MSATTPAAQPTTASALASSPHDDGDLAEFGYEQQLHRSLGKFASFAAGFSFVSILTTIFQLFGLGFGFAGPAFFWTWPVVFIGQFMVALNFAELAARYPISGAIYQWSRRMGGEIVGWFAGWFMILAQIVTASAAAIALQVVLPNVWSGFQIIGEDSALTSSSGAANAVLLGSVLLVLTTFINCIGVNWMSRINNIGVTCEIVGVIAVIGMFFTHAQRGPDVVFDTGSAGGQPGYVWAWIMSGLMAAYVMVGFGSAGELAEETRNPRRVAPRTIRLALSASALGGGLMILGALMAAPSLTDGRLATEGLPYVLTSILSSPWGTVLLDRRRDRSVHLHLGHSDCCFTADVLHGPRRAAACLAGTGKGQPPHRNTHRAVRPHRPGLHCRPGRQRRQLGNFRDPVQRLHHPDLPRLPHGDRAAAGSASQGMASHGSRPKFDAEGKKLFSLGISGVPVNIAAVVYGALMVINLSWPRAEIFNPTGEYPILQWAAPITVALVVGLGVACFPRGRATPNPVTIGA